MGHRSNLFLSVVAATLACNWLHLSGAEKLAVDNIWYVESGKNIATMHFTIETFVFSPLYSLLAYTWWSFVDNTSKEAALKWIACLLFSTFTWHLLLEIPEMILQSVRDRGLRKALKALLVAAMVLNPILLKYSLPVFSDSFGLIAGILFAFFHGGDSVLANPNLVNGVSRALLGLKQRPKVYFSLVAALCLFRYGNVFLLIASLTDFAWKLMGRSTQQLSEGSRKGIRLALITVLSSVFITGLMFILRFYQNCSEEIMGSMCDIWEQAQIPQRLVALLMLTVGGREGLRWALNDPAILWNFDLFQKQYAEAGHIISNAEYHLSLLYMAVSMVSFVVSAIGIYRFAKGLATPYLLGLGMLLVTEAAIGVAHQRYFLPFAPSLYMGLFLFARNHWGGRQA